MVNFSKIDIKNFFKSADVFKKNIGLIFWLILVIIFVLEIFVIKDAVFKVIESYNQPIIQKKEKGVRVNFEDYYKIINRIKAARNFKVTEPVKYDPFNR